LKLKVCVRHQGKVLKMVYIPKNDYARIYHQATSPLLAALDINPGVYLNQTVHYYFSVLSLHLTLALELFAIIAVFSLLLTISLVYGNI
jgi:hypothetical protein